MSTHYVRVSVTQDHIDTGFPSDPYGCPIYKAMSNCLNNPENDLVAVELHMVWLANGNEPKPVMLDLPKIAQLWINWYDTGKIVKPLSFYLSLPKDNDGNTLHLHYFKQEVIHCIGLT